MANGDSPKVGGIGSIMFAGTGCPAQSVYADLSSDAKVLTLRLPYWFVQYGPSVPMSENRKTCNLNVDLDYPAGWSFAVADFEYSGYAVLDAGIVGQFSLKTKFSGSGNSPANMKTFAGTIAGPFEDNFRLRNGMSLPAASSPAPAPDSLLWSPCGIKRSLQLYNQARLGAAGRVPRNAEGLLTVDTVDEDPKIKYMLLWRRCP